MLLHFRRTSQYGSREEPGELSEMQREFQKNQLVWQNNRRLCIQDFPHFRRTSQYGSPQRFKAICTSNTTISEELVSMVASKFLSDKQTLSPFQKNQLVWQAVSVIETALDGLDFRRTSQYGSLPYRLFVILFASPISEELVSMVVGFRAHILFRGDKFQKNQLVWQWEPTAASHVRCLFQKNQLVWQWHTSCLLLFHLLFQKNQLVWQSRNKGRDRIPEVSFQKNQLVWQSSPFFHSAPKGQTISEELVSMVAESQVSGASFLS